MAEQLHNRTIERILGLVDEQSLVLQSGVKLVSLEDLSDSLVSMDTATYAHHTQRGQNDFSIWIDHVFGDWALAAAIRDVKDKRVAAQRIRERIDTLTDLQEKKSVQSAVVNKNMAIKIKSVRRPGKRKRSIVKKPGTGLKKKSVKRNTLSVTSKRSIIKSKKPIVKSKKTIVKRKNVKKTVTSKNSTLKEELKLGFQDYTFGLLIGFVLGLLIAAMIMAI